MIRFQAVALRRGTRLLVSDASFTIHRGQKVGLTGANGAGKSSLLSALLGGLPPDAGEVSVPPGLVIAHVEQEVATGTGRAIDQVMDGDREFRELQARLARVDADRDVRAFAAAQNRFEAIGGYSATARAARLMSGLGFGAQDQERPVNEFSGGWRMRLGLARALMCRSDLLLLDEPTNHLDLDAILWLQDWLVRYEGTLILISHDREFLDAVVDHILHIENQSAELFPGDYSSFEARRAERLAQIQTERAKQQREVERIQHFIDRFRAKATKAKQAQSRMKTLARMDLIAQAHVDSPLDFTFPPPAKLPAPLLRLERACAAFGSRVVIDQADFSLMPGDRIGLLGANGAGKSTLMKLLAGVLAPTAGRRLFGSELAVGYFAQHSMEQLHLADTAVSHLQRLDPRAPEKDLRSFLGRFGFSGDRATSPVETYSGGEKARLGLALLVYQRPNLLLLDEPTNHLDLDMRFSLVRALQDYDGGLVLVSHDRYLLRSVVDAFWLVEGGQVLPFAGDLEDYRRRVEQTRTENSLAAAGAGESARDRRRNGAERRERLRPMEIAVKRAEEELERITGTLRQLELDLADPELYRDKASSERLRLLAIEKSRADLDLRRAEEQWMAVSEALECARQVDGRETKH